PEVPQPEIPDTATESERQSLAIKALWANERFDLNCWISSNVNEPEPTWLKVGSLPMRNPSGYPYVRQKVLDLYTDALMFECGENSAIALSIEDAGWGMPTADDEIVISGAYVYEHQLINLQAGGSIDSSPSNSGSTGTSNSLSANDLLFSTLL
ncbi:MAG: hypothetical protein F6J92_21575, partial [Symploca sp. SIO1A3]|nr:hypothetical protein [Symploca sp. SIO1A3]